ncbi:13591_t:CDS:1 [Gigaspora margarita]|uniref:13591_t:CDS:1 n=1 Tax=Gigaspora margarita TaxID=4874 RepID=A0ABN7W8A0_GIGMA|nr:13591_t:CDS:1 [Gigaspora margarita]
MSKVQNRSRSSSPSELERESSRVPISQQKIDFNNEPHEIVISVNNLIREFGDVRTTKRLDLLWNSSVNTRAKAIPRPQNQFILFRKDITAEYNPQKNINDSKKRVGKNVSKSSKIAKERWAAIKNFNQHEYKFWEKLTEIANLKHKLLYPNYKYIPIRNKNKKCKSNNNKQQLPLITNDIIKTTEVESNKKIDSLQIQETNNTQALSVNNNCQNNSTIPIEPFSDSYLAPSFLPHYLSHEYRQTLTASRMMPVQFTHNPYLNYLQYYQPQGYFIFNDIIDPVLINENGTVDSNFSNFRN